MNKAAQSKRSATPYAVFPGIKNAKVNAKSYDAYAVAGPLSKTIHPKASESFPVSKAIVFHYRFSLTHMRNHFLRWNKMIGMNLIAILNAFSTSIQERYMLGE